MITKADEQQGRVSCWQLELVGGQKARQGFPKTFSQPPHPSPPSPAVAASQRGNPEENKYLRYISLFEMAIRYVDNSSATKKIQRIYSYIPHTSRQSGRGTWPESWSWMSTYHREPHQAGALKAGSLQGGQKSLSGELSIYSPTILWLSMPILVSSWIRRSVSYKLCKCKLVTFGSTVESTTLMGQWQ